MDLKEYFEKADGVGVFSTSDKAGVVNSAIYGRPRVEDDGRLVFVMLDRRTRANLCKNPHAIYLFKEDAGYVGKRLYIIRLSETDDPEIVQRYRRGKPIPDGEKVFVAYFELTDVRPLVGG